MIEQLEQTKTRIQLLAESNRSKIGQGIRKPRFRKPKNWTVQNRILMAILIAEDVKLSELAELVGVAPRTVAAWIYEGVYPTEEHRAFIAHRFGLPQTVLFYPDTEWGRLEGDDSGKFYKRALLGAKKNRILAGLFAVHGISPAAFSRKQGVSPGTTRKYMHAGAMPEPTYRTMFSEYFGLPEEILFYEAGDRKDEAARTKPDNEA
ncbi:helix-turn-helix domain-containing protein [Cohnella sp. AR92]|uniref:helix-turn-helix domain-containing protein n=1 Tax=Cohnella sp. AR92 TaxID=648716 RepID=UPI000F8DFAC0|nr:helix-turn-helix domain-containing protein [Cohnella sp. AR92]RUS42855.1 helix-turn-helix domain-containing protein [Cohnella sp. AR92]